MICSPTRLIAGLITGLILLSPNIASAQDYTTGLVGHWKLDETSGIIATDSTGSNNGTMVGGLDAGSDSVAGTVDTAINFDGSNDNINIADHNDLDFAFNEDFTVSTWVKIPTNQNDTSFSGNSIIEKWSGIDGYPYVIRFQNQTHADPGYIYCARYDGTNNPVIKSTFTLNDNNYHHIACVKNAGIISLYIDGVLDGTTPDTTTGTTTNSSSLYFGQRGTPSNRYTGSIDDVRIYDRALTDTDISALYGDYTCSNPNGVTGEM